MHILKLFCFIIAQLAFTLVCILFVNWWAPLFADEDGWLPDWLSWVQTFDDTLDAGQRDGKYSLTTPRYWARVLWLYRNPCYGFSYWCLGARFNPEAWVVRTNTPKSKGPLTFYAVGPNGLFNWYGERFGIKFKIGWKAWNMFDQATLGWKTYSWGPEWRIPFTFSISLANN